MNNQRMVMAQKRNAALYRKYEEAAPRNSKTRKGWAELAQSAENAANFFAKK